MKPKKTSIVTSMPTNEGFVNHVTLCARVGCPSIAQHMMKVWMPVTDGGAVTMICGVKLCEHHANTLGPYDVLKREVIEDFIRRVSRNNHLNFPAFGEARMLKTTLPPPRESVVERLGKKRSSPCR